MDFPYKDLSKWLNGDSSYQSLKLVPVIGKIAYDRGTEKGQTNTINKTKSNYTSRLKDAVKAKDSAEISKVRKDIREYNSTVPKEERITTSAMSRVISAAKKSLSPKSAEAGELEDAIEKYGIPWDWRENAVGVRDTTGKIKDVIGKAAKRLKVDEEKSLKNMMTFIKVLGEAENKGKLTGDNVPVEGKEKSGAKGLYQTMPKTIEPSLNRLSRAIGWEDWMLSAIEHKDANKLTWEQQTLMTIAQLTELKGTDKYVKKVLESADRDAMTKLYYEFHHTKPDIRTRLNWNRAMKTILGRT